MRLAFLGDGSLNHVRRWAGYFHEQGHEVLLLSFESVAGCPFPARRIAKRLPTKLLGYCASLGAVRSALESFRPDLVSALYAGGYGLIGGLSGFRPLAVSSLGSDLLVDYPSSFVHRIQIRYVLRRADLIITDADVLSRRAAEIGAAPGKILKVYFGVDETVFYPAAARSVTEPRTGDRPRIVSTRNLYPIYHLDLLLEAARIIRGKCDALFIVCGDGPERMKLEKRARALGLTEDFILKGTLEPRHIAEELRSAAVYVSTSRSDSTSVSLLEAMACGVPPIVTDIPANREWLTDGDNGLLVPIDDPGALAEAVLRMIEDPGFAASVRQKNLEVIAARGLWHENMRRVAETFRRLIDESSH